MSTMNYYVVLGIAEDADSDAIRSAFRALARRYHPDTGAGSSTAEFRRVLEAYETLSDPARRRRHDRDLQGSRVGPGATGELIARSRYVAEPLITPRAAGFAHRRAAMRPLLLDELFEELFRSMDDDWFWRWRGR